MKNKDAFSFFKHISEKKNDSPLSVKLANASDFSGYDAEFILKRSNKDTTILDLGSGTGLILNKIYDKVKSITAVEPFESFTKHIIKSDNIEIINDDIFNYSSKDKRTYDMITMFGLMQYFNEAEARNLYKEYFKMLKKDGTIIVKNQLGVEKDVVVSGYSEEQKTDYFSEYRHVDKEVQMLIDAGFNNIEVHDIYPPECNRWDNTHFYALVGEK